MATLTVGCAGVVNTLTSTRGVMVTRNVAYGPLPAQTLDIYAPAGGDGPFPAVVFLHGGGWTSGAPADYRFLGSALASRGVVAFIAGYRLFPDVAYPDFLRDGARAVAWAHVHAESFGADPRCLFVMGHSAGAYNAMMLALDERWLAGAGLRPSAVLAGAIGLAGPYDFLPIRDPEVRAVFAPAAADLPSTQPINHVTSDAPPIFLASGLGDTTVRPGNTERLAGRLAAAGDRVTMRLYPRIGHILLIGAFAWPVRWTAPVLADTLRFIRTQPGCAAR
ncbi:alpha/beta hydrolase [Acidisphaera rubrifaciens]|uniref:Esterase/lipase n=1 Tax=Acidisphaera rubrifaciens HS-AP3 TaxID=1231350 RepID=A0A0D6P958_9PROT|nr:alpha/beta hydrolase [Acidisphaera rubrifaciens]GAN77399.1 esterase/lipase [Acidisphaera rubrifaciens HS-AP3]